MVDNDGGLIVGAGLDLEWPELDIALHALVLILSSDKSLSIEDGVGWVSSGLILSSISDESFFFGEGNVRGSGVESLIVGDNLDLVVHPHSDAGVCGSEINSDSGVRWGSHFEYCSVLVKLNFMNSDRLK